jgi:hypothetical protein
MANPLGLSETFPEPWGQLWAELPSDNSSMPVTAWACDRNQPGHIILFVNLPEKDAWVAEVCVPISSEIDVYDNDMAKGCSLRKLFRKRGNK